jgi:Cu+-exporting ATPase
VVFDKTGTLTRGKPGVTDVTSFGIGDRALLSVAASVEHESSHPLAAAVVAYAAMQGVEPSPVTGFDTYGGKGITAVYEGRTVLIGNRALMQEQGIAVPVMLEEELALREKEGKTGVIVAIDGGVAGVISLADTLKLSAAETISALKGMGLEVAMITGDNERTARAVAAQAGIGTVIAQVLPEQKAAEVKKLQEQGRVVAFVGDGINDAPALAQADVGIAVGSGTDVAIESGDIVLIHDDLLDAVAGIQLAKKVMSRIKQNLFWAFAYNTALIPVAAGVLYPVFGILFRPELAGLAMALSSVTVVSLSLMLKGYTPPALRGRAAGLAVPGKESPEHPQEEGRGTMAIDPVCKMHVDPAATTINSDYRGQKFYFCSPGCKKAFDSDPQKYLKS